MAAARPLMRGASRRTVARLAAVQALYQMELGQGDAELVIAEFIEHRLGREIDGEQYRDADADWFAELVRGVSGQRAAVDAELAAVLDANRPLARLDAILRAALRAAVHELMARSDVDARVAITEYVAIVNAFYSDKTEAGLANAILDRAARRLRPQEFAG